MMKTPDWKNEIYTVGKYLFSAGTSFLLDICLFTVFQRMLSGYMDNLSIILATILARVLSSIYNYCLNSRFVFRSHDSTSLVKYYTRVICQMLASAGGVYGLKMALPGIHPSLIKVGVDIFLFCVNYLIQRTIIFNKK